MHAVAHSLIVETPTHNGKTDMTNATHNAWRFFPSGSVGFVEHIGNGQQRGDRYSYTSDVNKAKPMTEAQCRAFCAYMRECASVGFWA